MYEEEATAAGGGGDPARGGGGEVLHRLLPRGEGALEDEEVGVPAAGGGAGPLAGVPGEGEQRPPLLLPDPPPEGGGGAVGDLHGLDPEPAEGAGAGGGLLHVEGPARGLDPLPVGLPPEPVHPEQPLRAEHAQRRAIPEAGLVEGEDEGREVEVVIEVEVGDEDRGDGAGPRPVARRRGQGPGAGIEEHRLPPRAQEEAGAAAGRRGDGVAGAEDGEAHGHRAIILPLRRRTVR